MRLGLGFQTAIEGGSRGETRIGLLPHPRLTATYDVVLGSNVKQVQFWNLYRQTKPILFPLWTEAVRVLAATSDSVAVDGVAFRLFAVGQPVLLLGNPLEEPAHKAVIESISNNVITFSPSAPSGDIHWAVPLALASPSPEPSFGVEFAHAMRAVSKVRFEQDVRLSYATPFVSYDTTFGAVSYEGVTWHIFPFLFEWRDRYAERYDTAVSAVVSDSLVQAIVPLGLTARGQWETTVAMFDRWSIARWMRFFELHEGQKRGFLLPTGKRELELREFGANVSTIKIAAVGFAQWFSEMQNTIWNRRLLMIVNQDTWHLRRVMNATASGGFEYLALNSPVTVTPSSSVMFCVAVRFATDDVELSFYTTTRAEARISVVEDVGAYELGLPYVGAANGVYVRQRRSLEVAA